jgi:hypothetical protein
MAPKHLLLGWLFEYQSAPILIVVVISTKLDIRYTILAEYFFFIKAAKPFPLSRPILAHIS